MAPAAAGPAVAGAAADSEAVRQELLLRVAEPYFDVFAAEGALALRATERATLSRQLEQAERRFEVGLIDITDVDEARAELDRAAADVLTAQRALGAAQQTLRGIVGEPVGELRPLVEDLPLVPPDPSSAEEWIETALERNPVLVSTRIRAESASITLPGFLPGDAAPLELRRAPGADGSLEVPGLPPYPAEVVLRAGDGREIRRETVKPAGE